MFNVMEKEIFAKSTFFYLYFRKIKAGIIYSKYKS